MHAVTLVFVVQKQAYNFSYTSPKLSASQLVLGVWNCANLLIAVVSEHIFFIRHVTLLLFTEQ